MEIAIIGLPKTGKTTVFNALTKGNAKTGTYTSSVFTPNIGVAKVPDSRIDQLVTMFKPKKISPAEVKYVDIAIHTTSHTPSKEGLDDQTISYLINVDAIMHVVRAFKDENVPHINNSIDIQRDIAAIELELAFSDLALIEKRITRIQSAYKAAKQQEREAGAREIEVLGKIKTSLEKEIPVRQQSLTEEELKIIHNYKFLTAKPILVIINIGEADIPNTSQIENELRENYKRQHSDIAVVCGKPEMELSQLDAKDAEEFRSALGLTTAGLDRVLKSSYKLLGLISFFTVGPDEVKAWTIHHGTTAVKAAGKIHTDLERGFIRAEVIGYTTLMEYGGMTEAKKHGLLKMEGKTYIVQDGDIMNILFNV
jgi:GTP-binding protein YchF